MIFFVTVDSERCKGCEICVSFCQRKVLKMSGTINSKGYHCAEVVDEKECVGCLQCVVVCPDTAIEIQQESE